MGLFPNIPEINRGWSWFSTLEYFSLSENEVVTKHATLSDGPILSFHFWGFESVSGNYSLNSFDIWRALYMLNIVSSIVLAHCVLFGMFWVLEAFIPIHRCLGSRIVMGSWAGACLNRVCTGHTVFWAALSFLATLLRWKNIERRNSSFVIIIICDCCNAYFISSSWSGSQKAFFLLSS